MTKNIGMTNWVLLFQKTYSYTFGFILSAKTAKLYVLNVKLGVIQREILGSRRETWRYLTYNLAFLGS
jgi:hypothetical protein